jgi:Transglutaminase-like superfamily
MWKAFQRYKELGPEAQRLFWRAAVLLPFVALSLRVRGFQRTKQHLVGRLALGTRLPVESHGETDRVQTTCRMVRAAAHHGLGRPTCLEQSLVLWYLLEQRHISAQFRIGVRKLPEAFEAHAWVEHQGMALNQPEQAHQHYAAFDSELLESPKENA